MRKTRRKFAKGITLVELIIGVVVSLIVVATAGLLMVAGHKNWGKTYRYAYGDVQVNAIETMVAFGKTGRMSNKSDYVLYNYDGSTFDGPVLPSDPLNPVEVVTGSAIEFRYWDAELQDSFMDTDVTGNAYKLFYVEDGELRAEKGAYPPGGVDGSGNKLNPASTYILARNVQSVVFSHTTQDKFGNGNGCIKMDLTLYDPKEDKGIHVKTATLMRNVWP
ncbi:MAG: hypothetical protein JW787_18525 [Sedimentisphaerales bacterium]|nr:hypothetical protein [Sedimentisphaerales bacterium]